MEGIKGNSDECCVKGEGRRAMDEGRRAIDEGHKGSTDRARYYFVSTYHFYIACLLSGATLDGLWDMSKRLTSRWWSIVYASTLGAP